MRQNKKLMWRIRSRQEADEEKLAGGERRREEKDEGRRDKPEKGWRREEEGMVRKRKIRGGNKEVSKMKEKNEDK